MGAPQIIYLVFTALGLFVKAAVHGQKAAGTHNFAVYFVAKVFTVAILFWGGFFGGG